MTLIITLINQNFNYKFKVTLPVPVCVPDEEIVESIFIVTRLQERKVLKKFGLKNCSAGLEYRNKRYNENHWARRTFCSTWDKGNATDISVVFTSSRT